MKIQKQFNHEARFMRNLRMKHDLSQNAVYNLINPNGTCHGQLISNLERNKGGLSLKNWIIIWANLKFNWVELAEAMANDQRDYALNCNSETLIVGAKATKAMMEDHFHNKVQLSALASQAEINRERADIIERSRRNIEDGRMY